jgi:two-component system, sensor histidine kinase PdtaS
MEFLTERFGRLSTSIKILSILTLVLLPFGLIALFGSLDNLRRANAERSADLRVALTESTRKLSAELAADQSAMQAAANAIAANVSPQEVCLRLSAIFTAHARRVSQFAVFGPASAPLCATPGFNPQRPSTLSLDTSPRGILMPEALILQVPAARGAAIVVVNYTPGTLADFAQPSSLTVPYAATLSNNLTNVQLRTVSGGMPLGAETVEAPVGLLGLTLSISVAQVPFGATQAMLTFLPLLMWVSASLIGFFVVDRLLIRPLRALQLSVARHVPGTPFRLPAARTPAREIRELGETFAQFGDQISEHETNLATALADQTRATREVHHRVKNNLQVIASLISLHARSAQSPDAITAYGAIQRRVDALSIVHRNHYAELDTGGIDIKGLLSELATNLRAGAGATPAISVRAVPFGISQDNAVALAFLVTELVELSITTDNAAAIGIAVDPAANADKARLSVTSSALSAPPGGRYARVIEGLARQLRAPLDHDPVQGRFAIEFAVFADDDPHEK